MMNGTIRPMRNEDINDGSVYNCKFHSVFPLCKTTLFRACAIARSRATARARFFVRFNSAHRFSLPLEQFLVYINANRQESSSRALVRDKSNSVANGSRRFLSIPLARTHTHTHIRVLRRTCPLRTVTRHGTSISS